MPSAEPVRCRCGRPLRDPVSRARGLGPVCARRLGLATRHPPAIRATDAPVEPMPGQTELPLIDHQPTLWSL